jgi:hypothetical protein
MFEHHHFYHHGSFGRFHHYPWSIWRSPVFRTGFAPIGGVGAVQNATNVQVGNFTGTAFSRQRFINTGNANTTTQTSTPTVVR